jgi:hypothetical protein
LRRFRTATDKIMRRKKIFDDKTEVKISDQKSLLVTLCS